jgi:3-deoxy-7-phosphoheptulonate synthase
VVVIAGPCSVEGREAVLETARAVRDAGAHLLRGGAFKPRTSPYSFQGLGVEGLRQLKAAGEAVGLPVVSEIMDASDLRAFVEEGIDCLQIGARNMQNFTLLKSVAGSGLPVLLKRGLAATVEEWLAAAEYLAHGGAQDVILCERGIRTFERATRNTLDLTVLPLLREWTHLAVVVDPAHAAGIARIIPPLARASIAAGADAPRSGEGAQRRGAGAAAGAAGADRRRRAGDGGGDRALAAPAAEAVDAGAGGGGARGALTPGPGRARYNRAVDLTWIKSHLNSEPVKYAILLFTAPLWLPFLQALWRALNDALREEGGVMGVAPTENELEVLNRERAREISPLVSVTWEEHERGHDAESARERRSGAAAPVVRPRGFRSTR